MVSTKTSAVVLILCVFFISRNISAQNDENIKDLVEKFNLYVTNGLENLQEIDGRIQTYSDNLKDQAVKIINSLAARVQAEIDRLNERARHYDVDITDCIDALTSNFTELKHNFTGEAKICIGNNTSQAFALVASVRYGITNSSAEIQGLLKELVECDEKPDRDGCVAKVNENISSTATRAIDEMPKNITGLEAEVEAVKEQVDTCGEEIVANTTRDAHQMAAEALQCALNKLKP